MTSPLPGMPVPHGQAEEREVLRDHPKPFTEVYRGRWQAWEGPTRPSWF